MSDGLCACGCGQPLKRPDRTSYLAWHNVRRPEDRFWEKVAVTDSIDTCWEWLAQRNPDGYGRFFSGPGGRDVNAHRWAYEWARVTIADGLVADHLCRNRGCVNPWHIEPVTNYENNVVRGQLGIRTREKAANQTECKHGHSYTPENTEYNTRGQRRCKECRRQQQRRTSYKRRVANRGPSPQEECPGCGRSMIRASIPRHLRNVHKAVAPARAGEPHDRHLRRRLPCRVQRRRLHTRTLARNEPTMLIRARRRPDGPRRGSRSGQVDPRPTAHRIGP